MKNTYNLRSIAATAINQVLDNGQSLSTVLPDLQRNINDKDKALLQEICFGVLRYLPKLEWFISQLMEKPLTGKQRTLHYLIMVGIYQLLYTRIPPHAALAETVNGAVALKKPQLKGLINGVLRSFQRQQVQLEERITNNTSQYLHPSWLLKRLQTAYPDDWQSIIEANNQRPPMWLRVNSQHHTATQYLNLLEQSEITAHLHSSHPNAIRLDEPTAVSRLPGFEDGWSTVQDVSAQGCAELLEPQNGENILDLCAAPGGKTTHILELAPKANVIAVDIDESRLKRVKENLIRLKQHAVVIQGDGTQPETWAQGQQFDRILLDAPCSATGVIRRHPDIKWLRRDSDINELAQLQSQILEAIWPYLKPGGTLVYATCSIMPEENGKQIHNFLSKHNDACLNDGTDAGLQILPSTNGGDGFFYARLVKKV
ncbi:MULTISPECIES: 16S rRNA (cytosine(967)-C(5))-methyltransferase RsmB [Providencia]|uniref:16S rRNA (cytosine(967)-C(5))-methyltransferase n=1 Tax=Providencia rettgeri TaxID=587 RepID=A0AB35LI78_PRORE|nr:MULTISPECIES: 16S rRNA (cytosine(967)-C(5))-methyltransferase RsmB [Providencia]AWS50083.1 16S rRNA (cytosine(967)-C(5))-methyltransferase [Providencia rettgeri]EJD6477770.1 16S rRNA (cytosine(967)-C(5))-methyltransferase RsmB [Providencia rettgeri]ELH9585892.1 16S rRNA (cytosine(967)-C(5))-methyltransferase RsmB [Providencia rettgeri]ELM3939584.1 16S rRNA (cytosine(967)-C(5))-methyltransferase RsmB [Providencia rettgeri]ELR5067937.1 16S rRNA (cytosine(967)-C(5))-methyltransferase RsmB [Pro